MILVKSHSLEHATALKTALGDQVSVINCQGSIYPSFFSLHLTHQRLGLTVSSDLTALAVKLEDDHDPN